MISYLLSRIIVLVLGNLYPAYSSYKAVRTKNVKEYVKWMMYWIVFAIFTLVETFADILVSFWFPFYYEIKIIFLLWLLCPATKGSSIIYRRFLHPTLTEREAEIDEAIAKVTEQGYTAVLQLGSKGVNYATTVLMQTAIKGGGGLVQHLKKSYSLSDLSGEKDNETQNSKIELDKTDGLVSDEYHQQEIQNRKRYNSQRSQFSSDQIDMYFSEMDVSHKSNSVKPINSFKNIKSTEDISNIYNNRDILRSKRNSTSNDNLLRTTSLNTKNRIKARAVLKKTPEIESFATLPRIKKMTKKKIT